MRAVLGALVLGLLCSGAAQPAPKFVDIPTRPGVTQRFVLISPADAKAAVVLFAGGHGGLQISDGGAMQWGSGNFLVRSAALFADRQLVVAIADAPSDRQAPPHLSGFREGAEHAADIKALIAWLRQHAKLPVWLVGTSRGTQSVAAVATRLAGRDAPDGLVLTASILNDPRSRPLPDMPLESIRVPVLVVHHEQDACRSTLFRDVPRLMEKLSATPKKELLTFRGGEDHGPACEGRAYHGFNGLETQVVDRIADWILSR